MSINQPILPQLTPELLSSLDPELRRELKDLLEQRAEILRSTSAREEHSTRGHRDPTTHQWLGGLYSFVKYFWHVLEPETPLVHGWPVEAICQHLEAVTFGEINRLLINVPPGFMKSLLTDVFWPAWEWGPMKKGHLRYVTFSYSSSLTERDNRRFGDLVSCKEYQDLYAADVRIVKKGDTLVSNRRKGWKLASSVGGVGTGERGDRVILDDPHNVKEAESDVVRTETVRWFRESMSNRLNDLDRGAIVIIMQRVHGDDVSGVILSLGLDYCHLMIPMEYDWQRQVDGGGNPYATQIGWTDPRYIEADADDPEGENAWPARFSDATNAATKMVVGPYAWAGQYQQSPSPRGGGIFKEAWWQVWESNDGKFPPFDYVIASLDSAFTEKEQNDPSALTIWGVFTLPRTEHQEPTLIDYGDGNLVPAFSSIDQRRIMLIHAWRKHLQFSGPRDDRRANESAATWVRRTQEGWGLVEWVKHTCERFHVDKLLIEGKASGISAAQELRNRYGRLGFAVQLQPVKGDKVARALGVQATFSQLIVYAPVRDWSDMVIEEMAAFPKHKYDDLTDSATQAIKHLRDTGMAKTDHEVSAEDAESIMHRRKPKALYPV